MKLYKYGRCSDHLIQSLVERTIWLASPYSFNDCLEGAFRFLPEEPGKVMSVFNENPIFKSRLHWQYEDLFENHRSDDSFNDIVMGRYEIYRSLFGLTSFSETNTNLLMWAHYADESRGVCIEYEADINNPNLFPVTYTNTLPSLSTSDILYDSKPSMIKVLTTKSIDWSYEREWRLVHEGVDQFRNEKGGGLVPSPFTITGIAFGHRVENEKLNIFRQVLNDTRTPTSLAYPSDMKYAMDIADLRSSLPHPILEHKFSDITDIAQQGAPEGRSAGKPAPRPSAFTLCGRRPVWLMQKEKK